MSALWKCESLDHARCLDLICLHREMTSQSEYKNKTSKTNGYGIGVRGPSIVSLKCDLGAVAGEITNHAPLPVSGNNTQNGSLNTGPKLCGSVSDGGKLHKAMSVNPLRPMGAMNRTGDGYHWVQFTAAQGRLSLRFQIQNQNLSTMENRQWNEWNGAGQKEK